MRNQIEYAIRKLSTMQNVSELDEFGAVRPSDTDFRKFFLINQKPAPVKLSHDIRNYWKQIQTA